MREPTRLLSALAVVALFAAFAPARSADAARSADSERVAFFLRLLDRAEAVSLDRRHRKADELLELAGAMAEVNQGPRWVAPLARFHRGLAALRRSDRERAVAHIHAAVKAGFADPHLFHELVPPSLLKVEGLRKAYAAMKLNAGDLHELNWLADERAATARDFARAIAENIKRIDEGETRVPLGAIPERSTQSLSVLAARELLRHEQALGLELVRESDRSLRQHLATLPAPSDPELQVSRERARLRYLACLAAVRERAFRALTEGAEDPALLPPLGGLPFDDDYDFPLPPPQTEIAADPNPALSGLRVGDRWVYDQAIITPQGRIDAVYEEKVRAVTDRNYALEAITRVPGETPSAELDSSRLQPTLRLQLIADLRELGDFEPGAYAKSAERIQWRGQERAVTRVRLEMTWNVDGARQPGSITLFRNDQVPGLGAYRIELQQGATRLLLELRSFERGPEPKPEGPNPLKINTRLGDWFKSRSRTFVDGKLVEESIETETVTGLQGSRYLTRTEVQAPKDKARIRDHGSFFQDTLRAQILYDLDSLGELGLLDYRSREVKVDYRDQSWPCQEITLLFDLDEGSGLTRYTLTLVRSNKLPGLGLIRSTLASEGFRVETELQLDGRAKE